MDPIKIKQTDQPSKNADTIKLDLTGATGVDFIDVTYSNNEAGKNDRMLIGIGSLSLFLVDFAKTLANRLERSNFRVIELNTNAQVPVMLIIDGKKILTEEHNVIDGIKQASKGLVDGKTREPLFSREKRLEHKKEDTIHIDIRPDHIDYANIDFLEKDRTPGNLYIPTSVLHKMIYEYCEKL